MSDSAKPLLVGVDGGGTGCRAAIGTCADGMLALAHGGRANFATDPKLAIRNVLETVHNAAHKAGVSDAALNQATAHLGLAGVMSPQDRDRIAAAMPFAATTVTDDRPTSVTGALGGRDGYLLSVGTGTIVAACTGGAIRYVGGWGFYVADQASGAWLGRAALEQVLLCHDGLAEHTALTRRLFAKFDTDPNTISTFGRAAKPGDFGRFAPDIVAGAQDGDPWGQQIMKTGADHLAQSLVTLGFHPGDRLCLSGGLGACYADYLPPAYLSGGTKPCGNALDGAFYLAKSLEVTS